MKNLLLLTGLFALTLFGACTEFEECNDCNNGTCIEGTCYCDEGFTGPNCSQKENADNNSESFDQTGDYNTAANGDYLAQADMLEERDLTHVAENSNEISTLQMEMLLNKEDNQEYATETNDDAMNTNQQSASFQNDNDNSGGEPTPSPKHATLTIFKSKHFGCQLMNGSTPDTKLHFQKQGQPEAMPLTIKTTGAPTDCTAAGANRKQMKPGTYKIEVRCGTELVWGPVKMTFQAGDCKMIVLD